MRKIIIKVSIALTLILASIFIFVLADKLHDKKGVYTDASISIYDINNEVISTNVFSGSNDSLLDLLKREYNVKTSGSGQMTILLEIEEVKTDFIHTYIAVYVNGEYSQYGIYSIILKDNMKIDLKETKVK